MIQKMKNEIRRLNISGLWKVHRNKQLEKKYDLFNLHKKIKEAAASLRKYKWETDR